MDLTPSLHYILMLFFPTGMIRLVSRPLNGKPYSLRCRVKASLRLERCPDAGVNWAANSPFQLKLMTLSYGLQISEEDVSCHQS